MMSRQQKPSDPPTFCGVPIKYVESLDQHCPDELLFVPLTRRNLAEVKGIDMEQHPEWLSLEDRKKFWNGEEVDFTVEAFGRLIRGEEHEDQT